MGEKEVDVKKIQPHEMHNSELVSKLMAATPSYFFTPPQAGHNFFFSELLRSLVQKRKADELNSHLKAKCFTKKARKTPYTYQHQKPPMDPTDWKKQKLNETPTKTSIDSNENESPNLVQENSQDSVINVDKDDSPPSIPTTATGSGLHSNSAFYPYVDPLHFFIDLRVSAGQVYDKKKEAYLQQALKSNLLDSHTRNNPIIGRNRVGSAFKVPENSNNFSAMNLINQQTSESKFYPNHSPDRDEHESDRNDEEVEVQAFNVTPLSDKRNE